MKTKSAATHILPSILAALCAASLPAIAQPDAKPENRPMPQRGPAFQDRIMGGFQPGDFGAYRVLTEAQRKSYSEAVRAQLNQTRALEEKIRVARKDVLVAGLNEKFDEDAVRKKAQEVGKLETELAVLRAKVFSQVKPPLSAEQIEQIKTAPPVQAGTDRLRPVRRVDAPTNAPRDEHDLPPPPKSEK